MRKLGFYSGALDGRLGQNTRQAIAAYQRSRHVDGTGQLTQEQMNELLSGPQTRPPQNTIYDKIKNIRSLAEAGMRNAFCYGPCPFPSIIDLADAIENDLPRQPQPVVPQASTVPEPPKATNDRCQRIDPPAGASNGETIVVVDDRAMIFRMIKAPQDGEVIIGLGRDVSVSLYQRATAMFVDSTRPRPVNINKSVPETLRRLADFKLQTGLVDPELFKKFVKVPPQTNALDARQVSYNQAREFIDGLNSICNGKARFRLPKEEELTFVLMSIYYPNNMDGRIPADELKSCLALQRSETAFRNVFTDLSGTYWQLTESTCERFQAASPAPFCSGGKVVKGGTEQSYADECLPQFRGEVNVNVANPQTSFRLVLE